MNRNRTKPQVTASGNSICVVAPSCRVNSSNTINSNTPIPPGTCKITVTIIAAKYPTNTVL